LLLATTDEAYRWLVLLQRETFMEVGARALTASRTVSKTWSGPMASIGGRGQLGDSSQRNRAAGAVIGFIVSGTIIHYG
jgi:hypothetical protein